VVREVVDLVPRDLLREEPARAREPRELRQRRGVAERVRQPDLLAPVPERLVEVGSALDQLADHRLAAGQVGIGLHPHAADGNHVASRHGGLQPGEQLGLVLLEPG
jgi:hypothetical protein